MDPDASLPLVTRTWSVSASHTTVSHANGVLECADCLCGQRWILKACPPLMPTSFALPFPVRAAARERGSRLALLLIIAYDGWVPELINGVRAYIFRAHLCSVLQEPERGSDSPPERAARSV